jgi:shikimate dehydrogenase
MSLQLAVVGSPVQQSLSPVFQQAALDALALDARYTRIDTADGFATIVAALRSGQLDGVNVTVPNKVDAAVAADLATEAVWAIGAANTLWRDAEGRICAANTDVVGVLATLGAAHVDRLGLNVVVIGAGGAANAAAWALSHTATRVTVVNRTVKKAEQLAAQLAVDESAGRAQLRALRWSREKRDQIEINDALEECDVVINASAAGLTDASAFATLNLTACNPVALAFDMQYAALPTPFVQRATTAGLRTVDGATMLLHQGAAAFACFTEREAPFDVMREALAAALGRAPSSLGGAPPRPWTARPAVGRPPAAG